MIHTCLSYQEDSPIIIATDTYLHLTEKYFHIYLHAKLNHEDEQCTGFFMLYLSI